MFTKMMMSAYRKMMSKLRKPPDNYREEGKDMFARKMMSVYRKMMSKLRKPPYNYREVQFDFSLKKTVPVIGLACPDYAGQDPKETMIYLKSQGVKTIFGLEAHDGFIETARSLGLNYVDVSIPDFTAPDVALYDRVYDEILKQYEKGKKVAIHCHGGIGRTGSVLVAMKLKEYSMKNEFQNEELANARGFCDGHKCTLLVSHAIQEIRRTPHNEHVVEVDSQIDSLSKYEGQLRKGQEPSIENKNHLTN